jgi:hypothetical protein
VRRSYLIAAITLVALAAVWRFALSPRWTFRIPRSAVYTTEYFGTDTNADPKTGVVPEQDILSTYERVIRVIDIADWPRSVLLRDRYTTHDLQTGAVGFEYVVDERIDPRTGAWSDGPHKGEIVFFPRNVEKRTYILRSNYVEGAPLTFSGVYEIGGLEVYLFSYRGRLELTASYAGSPASPGVKVLAGQEIRCADDQFYYRAWVEPRTGRIVQVEEGCPSGDFVYDKASGKEVAAVDRWTGVTSGTDLDTGISATYAERRRYMWAALYVPAILLGGSVGLLAIGQSRRERVAVA